MTRKAIVWIREDLGIDNNPALSYASKNHEIVSAVYIYNKKYFDKKREAQKWWLSKSLEFFKKNLEKFNISLEILAGEEIEILSKIKKELGIEGGELMPQQSEEGEDLIQEEMTNLGF